ncbi:hypothetical protein RND81_11G039300 [Saponaria officinalis]|uniref:N-acetyltransferase domain-containing protein n=1 Tax=Saponaria officinalis TaxID=3572 RepID=A0AAW1HHS2_SAPOF
MVEEGTLATKIVWNSKHQKFETENKKSYIQYNFKVSKNGEQVMDLIHTYVPPSMRGLGLASLLCSAVFCHAETHSLLVSPTCSYVSDTFLPRNPSWAALVYKGDEVVRGSVVVNSKI